MECSLLVEKKNDEENGELTRKTDIKERAVYLQSLHLDTYANMKIKSFFKAQHLQSHMGEAEESAQEGAGPVWWEVSFGVYKYLPLFESSLYTTSLLPKNPTLVPVFPNQKQIEENFYF